VPWLDVVAVELGLDFAVVGSRHVQEGGFPKTQVMLGETFFGYVVPVTDTICKVADTARDGRMTRTQELLNGGETTLEEKRIIWRDDTAVSEGVLSLKKAISKSCRGRGPNVWLAPSGKGETDKRERMCDMMSKLPSVRLFPSQRIIFRST
jgi:hypothetical protein